MRHCVFLSLCCCLSAGGLVACSSETPASPGVDAGDANDSATEEDAGVDAPPAASCTAARDELLVPIDKVAVGEVTVVSEEAGEKQIYIDAAAGGPSGASRSPRVYVHLGTGAKVEITDREALESTAWDLALKRTVIYTNGGDAGPGQGGGAVVRKPFASVTAADVDAASFLPESFFDEECNAKLDLIGAPETTFSDWYQYDQATNTPTPRDITYLVKAADGARYKLKIESFTANPDGSTDRATTGYYLIRVKPL